MKTTPNHHFSLARLVLAGLFTAIAVPASAVPFADADIAVGEQMHAEYCVECHTQRFGGEDGSAIYTRADRRVNTVAELAQQLTRCTTMLKLDLFPEDEENIAAYLNKHYYKLQ